MEFRGVEQYFFPYVGSGYLPMFLLAGRSLTLMYIASLVVMLRICDSLPTVEKLANLV